MSNDVPPLKKSNSSYSELDIYKCYMESKFLSTKCSSYFQVYEELLGKYRDSKITLVEVGVLNGGSLFMWRGYLGEQARIIGIDLNPAVRKWEKEGFEIHIGDQADPRFWDEFFVSVGNVDVIVDDGGHANEQQIVTAHKCIPHLNDGGMLIVEDVHTSYFKEFGNPSRFSFVNYAKSLVDSVNSRFPGVDAAKNRLSEFVYSISFFESMVCFKIDRTRCFINSRTSNEGISSGFEDLSDQVSNAQAIGAVRASLGRHLKWLTRCGAVKRISLHVFSAIVFLPEKVRSRKLRKYFR